MNRRLAYILMFLLSWISVCAQERIIILNEGGWQNDNGTISYFNDGKVVSNHWFRDVNGSKLGDTPNDIIQVNDNLIAITVNWSNIIQFITPQGKAVAATEDVPNNRKLCTDGRYVYVSSYGHECNTVKGMKEFTRGFVAKIDTKTFQVVDAVEVGYEPEGIALYQGHLFVVNTGGYAMQENHDYETTISVLDATTLKEVKTIDTGIINMYGKLSQKGQYLCINSAGDYYDQAACCIIFDCEKALHSDDCFESLPYAATYSCTTDKGSFLAIGSRYSYITGDYAFNYITIDPRQVMESNGKTGFEESFPGTMKADIMKFATPYGIYQNPYTGYYYATDAAGYASGGKLYQWSPEGKLLGKHELYINPAHFLALPPDGMSAGINGVVAAPADDRCYDLSGRRIAVPVKGQPYIQGGKKKIGQ